MSQSATGQPYPRATASPSCPASTGKATNPGRLNQIRCRRGRALFRARRAEIWRVTGHEYRVPSQNDGGIYKVSLEPGFEDCTCPDFARYGRRAEVEPGEFYCKHLFAALMMRIKSDAESVAASTAAPATSKESSRVEAA